MSTSEKNIGGSTRKRAGPKVGHKGRTEAEKKAARLKEYRDKSELQRTRDAALAYEYANIAPLPPVQSPRRKRACRLDLERFLRSYFPSTSGKWPFSRDHKRMIARIEDCILNGGQFVNAVFRGFGKTTISTNSVLWALFYGHSEFCLFIASDHLGATTAIEAIKTECEQNDLIFADFPEIAHPIRKLDGRVLRARTQHLDGVRTHVSWSGDFLEFPVVEGSACSGSVVTCKGLTGSLRGMSHRHVLSGDQLRPDLAIIDDPQTDESAGSELQTAKRLNIINKTILQLGGHDKPMACCMNATVIQQYDLVDQLLDHEKNPAWQAERVPMVVSWSDAHETLWQQYAEIRRSYDPTKPGAQVEAWAVATKFYRANRKAMDKGAEVTWKHCYSRDFETSAIQHAYNKLVDRGPEVFQSEFQNKPEPKSNIDVAMTANDILARVVNYKAGEVPIEAQRITASIDVQSKCLFWLVAGWKANFTGWVLDYGVFPEQGASYFAASAAKRTLEGRYPGHGFEGFLRAGLDELGEKLASRHFKRLDGASQQIERCLVDANWGESTEIVYRAIAESNFSSILTPAHGKYYGASSEPINTRRHKQKQGEIVGLDWFMPPVTGRKVRHVVFDSNSWKSFVFQRLLTPLGDSGSLALFTPKGGLASHRMFVDHLLAEYAVKTFGRGREVNEWRWKPGRPDNHWLDCLVMSAVAASMQGVAIQGEKIEGVVRRKKVTVNREAMIA